ncbi:hypothetical protein ACVDG3_14120 [Meridianimarinicoccus sp. RP-17]|uniref:hypothetical protein n=1 Tax=Meridianimarinicoccus zhengii TaxID=2056810 RepID=UPI000DAB8DAE|nr:hypothetical protein [Phycocomes zhengii]
MTITTIPWIVVLAFGAIFIFAAVREYLHRRKYGPPENPRDGFEFDEEAPSYEEPEPLPDDTDAASPDAEDTGHPSQDDTPDADDDTLHKSNRDADKPTRSDADADTAPPDRNETPR